MSISGLWKTYLGAQHQHPSGFVGRIIGQRMVRQHAPETSWSIGLLGLQPADRVLELGCGAGRGLSLALAELPHGSVTGLDLSPTMISSSRRRNRGALGAGALRILRGNMLALPFKAQSFTKIVSIHTFYFWPSPYATLTSLVALLQSAGRLVITLATGYRQQGGGYIYWPIHRKVEELVTAMQSQPSLTTTLERGPDSRQYNNRAIVIQKRPQPT
jgi:ubiquinone/menaquinone biosynthesis C-methylase UbiE